MQLVMFDIDGTLTQSNDLDSEAFLQALFEVFGFSNISDDWAAYTHVTDACILKEVFQQQFDRIPALSEVAKFQQRFLELLSKASEKTKGVQPILGASTILSKLLASPDYQVAYAGGSWTAAALFKLQSANLPTQNIPFAFADDDESREGIMAIALRRAETQYKQSFSHIVYVGDGIWDVRSAKNLSYSFIGIASGEQADLLHREGAAYVFPNYRDLENFLAALAALRP